MYELLLNKTSQEHISLLKKKCHLGPVFLQKCRDILDAFLGAFST
jgi:hypothetical protein